MSRRDEIEAFLPSPLRPSDRAFLRRVRWQERLARYALSTGWSADGARWLSELDLDEALDRLAVAERRSPDEVMQSLASFKPKRRRRP